jgi:hypothetical protein
MDRIAEKFFGRTIKNEIYRVSVTHHLVELNLGGLLGRAPEGSDASTVQQRKQP